MAEVQEVFGKFMTEVGDKILQFDTEQLALEAAAMAENSEEILARFEAYSDAKGFEDKMKAGKKRVIVEFLTWEATQAEEEDFVPINER